MSEKDAQRLLYDASEKMYPKGLLHSLFGGASRVEEASKMYHRAANMFKMSEKWLKAGDTFLKVANLSAENKNSYDAATTFVDAADCYKMTIPLCAVDPLLKAIDIYNDRGLFTVSAKHYQTIAEIYESQKTEGYREKCLKNYEKAADSFRGEEYTSAAVKCQIKVAQYAAELKDYQKATSIYDQVVVVSVENSLPECITKDCFLKALLCRLCIDVINASNALTRYQEMCPDFQDTRECRLVKSILTHVEEKDLDAFTETAIEYDSISRLDRWTTLMLNRIKSVQNLK